MRGSHRRLIVLLAAGLLCQATGTAAASTLLPSFDDSFPAARSLTLPGPDLAPPQPPIEFAAGAGADAQALFRLPDAPPPQIEGPFAQIVERRGERSSFLPWEPGEEEDPGFAAAPLLPLLGATALLLWLVVAGGARPGAERPPRRRRRRRRSANPAL